MKGITRTVWVLSLVSLFTDTASEMLYPIMPVYLKSIGFSIVLIGVLEGIAEATAGFSKGYFGKRSDLSGKRVPFVQMGYALSALSKPLIPLFIAPLWVFFARTMDRLGKGIRTGARDAILSDEATPETKGKIFGFHRAMDTTGAVLGPLLALLYLHFYPANYKTLFFIAFIPGLLALFTSFLLKDKKSSIKKVQKNTSFFSFLSYWKTSPPAYRKLAGALLFFTLFNSSDVFLLLKAKEAGLSDTNVIGVYIFYNLVYALFAFPLGVLADKLGLKKIFIAGLAMFMIAYLGIAFCNTKLLFYFFFLIYGVYAAATEGVSKAWITNISDKKDTATAVGTYASLQSICTMMASSMAGLIWFHFNPTAAFLIPAIASGFVIVYMLSLKTKPASELKPDKKG
ncbi:MAG: MFS transporter [Bacteroidetes bacterium]|nr:MFS transporter [Bacteroidota bacterium]